MCCFLHLSVALPARTAISLHRCRLAAQGFNSPPTLSTTWFGTALNVADPPREHANGGGGERGGFGPVSEFEDRSLSYRDHMIHETVPFGDLLPVRVEMLQAALSVSNN